MFFDPKYELVFFQSPFLDVEVMRSEYTAGKLPDHCIVARYLDPNFFPVQMHVNFVGLPLMVDVLCIVLEAKATFQTID